ncbi:FG-GAP-like repeat-containing protein [Streptomyces sp. NPDC002825]|uniref:FG-GAP-like repeat-containing protein n=1 Tax=Streptomyces sp. NPDC002825 TaxID=3154666 RepID=UPI0033346714
MTLRVTRTSNNHWAHADQVIGGDFDGDTKPDVLIRAANELWFYRGTRAATIGFGTGAVAPIGDTTSEWNKYTIVSTGDINGDKLPDLLLRDDATGDLFRSYATADPANDKKMNFATWGQGRVKIGSGLTKSLYPQLGVSGDLDGDGSGDGITDGDKIPDLWARKADNTMVGWRGKGTPTSLTGFDAPYVIDGITGGIRLAPKTVIAPGHSITSQSSTLTMGFDGKLVITSKSGAKVWSSAAGPANSFARVDDNGNLSVCDAQNNCLQATKATNAGEGFAVLKDSGDLTVYNDKSQALWSSGTSVRHDYNGDGRSDIANWYDYGDGHDEIHSFATNTDGTFKAPLHAWSTPAGNYWAENMKHTTGDFNGDGIGDIAAFYGYEDGRVNLRTWLGKGDGNFNAPFVSWSVPAGHWNFDAIHAQSGDFNGDGRDDIAAWYSYGDGSDKLFTFTSNLKGGFNYPFSSFYRADGWYVPNMKFTTGDYNADGRDDLGVFYGYSNGDTKLFTFTAKPDGAFNEPVSGWSSTDWGSFAATSVHSGDFNGDGRDDIVTWYDYGDGHDAMISFTPSGTDGKFGNRREIWTIPAGNFWRENLKIVTGDFNGDGRDDVGGMYGYEDGRVKMFTWTAKTDGTLNYHLGGWEAAPGNWSFGGVRMIERYSPA